MRRFHFRLERLLRLKESERRQNVATLAEKKRSLEEREEALTSAHRAYDYLQESYAAVAAQPTSPAILMMAQYAMTAAQRHIADRRRAADSANVEVERARDLLIEKSREVDILERLRCKQWEEHVHEEGRRDQIQIDAIAVQQHVLRRQPSGESPVSQ